VGIPREPVAVFGERRFSCAFGGLDLGLRAVVDSVSVRLDNPGWGDLAAALHETSAGLGHPGRCLHPVPRPRHPPATPLANIDAFFDAARELYGN